MVDGTKERRILGINFFIGSVEELVERMMNGGLLAVPSAPILKDLPTYPGYREAVLNSDLVITDSGFMVMVWNILHRDKIPRTSGLVYLRTLLERPEVRLAGNTFWIMAGETSASRNLAWLSSKGISVPDDCVFLAPFYGPEIQDEALIERIRERRPGHIIVTLGGGNQERLGLYIKRKLDYRPSIHCIGAAIAFLSGDQVKIPDWADRRSLGWLYRCVSEPRRFVPRYWSAFQLAGLLLRYGSSLPPLKT